jgi:hypothetical protein
VVVRANGLELRSTEIAIPAPKPGQAADPGAGGNQYIGPITLTAVGEGGAPVMGGSPPARINGCAENRGLQPGESYTASWTFNGAYWTGNTYTFDGQAAEVCTWIAPGPGQQALPEGEVTLTIVINGIAETSGILRIGTDTVSQPATTPAPAGTSGG